MLHLLNIVWSIFNAVLRGLLIKLYWAWFVVSQFPQLPLITVPVAIGFSYMVSALSPWKGITAKEWEEIQNREKGDTLNLSLINSGMYTFAIAVSLGTGWLLHHFFM